MIRDSKSKLTFRSIIFLFTSILILVTALSAVHPESNSISEPEMLLSQVVDSASPKPGDVINFTISYLNPSATFAYNVTVFESIPVGLTLASSRPFYDGISVPDEGFLRWSRGDVASGEGGTIMVRMIMNNVLEGTNITNTVHLTFENSEGATTELTTAVTVIVAHGAGVAVYPDEVHGIPPYTHAETSYNVTVTNLGNAPDIFDISLSALVFDPTPAGKQWKIELFNVTGHLVASLYIDAYNDHNSWIDVGILTTARLDIGESTFFIIHEVSSEGVSGSGDAYTKVCLIATSQFDPGISSRVFTTTVVRSAVGITLAPDYNVEANPGQTVTFLHGLFNGGKAETIDLAYSSIQGWTYRLFFANGTELQDTNANGYVDVGELEKDGHADLIVKVTIPYGTSAGTADIAFITATGFDSGRYDNATDYTTVKTFPSVSVVKELVSDNPAYIGDIVTYRIFITNLGNTNLTRVPLDDAFETPSIRFESADPAPDSYSQIAGTIHWENITGLKPLQSVIVTINYVATDGDDSVRQSTNVIDAEDEFGNLVSGACVNKELEIMHLFSLTVSASPAEALGGTFDAEWTLKGTTYTQTFTSPTEIICDENTTATISNAQEFILKGETRYSFDGYSSSSPILMESNMTLALNYRTQYRVTFSQLGLDSSAVGTTVIVAGEPKTYADMPLTTEWLNSGTIISFQYSNLIQSDAIGKRFRLEAVNATSPLALDKSTTVSADYIVQYLVTFDAAGLDESTVGTVLIVNNQAKALSDLPFSMWVDEGIAVNYSFEMIVSSSTAQKRFRLDTIDGPESPLNATDAITVTASYVAQFYLTVITSPAEVLVLNPSAVSGEGWYDAGSMAYVNAVQIIPKVADQSGYDFRSWTVAMSGVVGNQASVLMNSGKTATANYQLRHAVIFDQAGIREDFEASIIAIDGKSYGIDSLPTLVWCDENSVHEFIFTSPLTIGGKRYVWTSTTGLTNIQGGMLNTTAPGIVVGNYKTQYYLATNTNFGIVTPESGWYDAASTVTVSASAPISLYGEQYIWYGWTGTGTLSYSGLQNPSTVTMNSAVNETAYWKMLPTLTITVDNETIARCDRIVIKGTTMPTASTVPVQITYTFPNGTQFTRTITTDNNGNFNDTLMLEDESVYGLFTQKGEWTITANREGNTDQEAAIQSTQMQIMPSELSQFSLALLVLIVVAVGTAIYAFVLRKDRKQKLPQRSWSNGTVILAMAALTIGLLALALNWTLAIGNATIDGQNYEASFSLNPLSPAQISITELAYTGNNIPSLIDSAWQSFPKSPGPIITILLLPVGCALALVGLYRPKTERQKQLRIIALIVAGVLALIPLVQLLIFVQVQTATIAGTGTGYGIGVYLAAVSGLLALFASLFAAKQVPTKSIQRGTVSTVIEAKK